MPEVKLSDYAKKSVFRERGYFWTQNNDVR